MKRASFEERFGFAKPLEGEKINYFSANSRLLITYRNYFCPTEFCLFERNDISNEI